MFYRFFLFFFMIFSEDRSIAREFGGIFFVITLPAAIIEFSLMVIGAINEVFEPIKTLSLIIIECLSDESNG